MHIGIDNISPGVSSSLRAIGGMRHFMEHLVAGFAGYASAHEFDLFTPDWMDPFETVMPSNVHLEICSGVPRQQVGRVAYEQFVLPGRLRRRRIDVWLGTCNAVPLGWRGPCVLMVQSLQYFTHPDAFTLPRRLYLRSMAAASIKRASQLVAFSQATKDEIVRRFGVSQEGVHVIPHAVRFRDLTPRTTGADRARLETLVGSSPYVLSVSGFYRYKNLPRLIAAYASVVSTLPARPRLVFVGAETPELSAEELRTVARDAGVEQDVILLGKVSDDDLNLLYQHAAAMAMVSLEETFGLPLIEAMALGCPVVTSDISSMREVAGSAAICVDPFNVESIATGLAQMLRNHELREGLVEAGRVRAQSFTYARFFERLLDVIERAAPRPALRTMPS